MNHLCEGEIWNRPAEERHTFTQYSVFKII